MAPDLLLLEQKDHVTTIVLNRPEKRNALSPELLSTLARVLEELKDDNDTRALIIRGAGDKAFSAGFDINSLPTAGTPDRTSLTNADNPFENALQAVSHFPYPVIAMMNGSAYGAGYELAVSCDFRVAAEGISMGMPPARLGIVYSAEGLMRFVRLLGFVRTKELFFTGRYYEAKQAKEMGLIDFLVPPSTLEAFTFKLAADIAGNSPLSVRGTKQVLGMIEQSVRLTEDQMAQAHKLAAESLTSDDLKEAQAAFLEKRMPRFKGR